MHICENLRITASFIDFFLGLNYIVHIWRLCPFAANMWECIYPQFQRHKSHLACTTKTIKPIKVQKWPDMPLLSCESFFRVNLCDQKSGCNEMEKRRSSLGTFFKSFFNLTAREWHRSSDCWRKTPNVWHLAFPLPVGACQHFLCMEA